MSDASAQPVLQVFSRASLAIHPHSAAQRRGGRSSLLDLVRAEKDRLAASPRNSRLDMAKGQSLRGEATCHRRREPLIGVGPGGLSEPLAGDGSGDLRRLRMIHRVDRADCPKPIAVLLDVLSGRLRAHVVVAPKMVLDVFPEVLVKIRRITPPSMEPAFLVRYSLRGSFQTRLCCGSEDRLPSRHSGCQSRRWCENQTDQRRTSAIVAARSQPRDP